MVNLVTHYVMMNPFALSEIIILLTYIFGSFLIHVTNYREH